MCLTRRYNNYPKPSKGSHTDITLGSHLIAESKVEQSKGEVYHNNILQVPLQPALGHHSKTLQAIWNSLRLHLRETEITPEQQNNKFFPHLYSSCHRMVPCLSQLLDHLFQQLLAILCLLAGINKGRQNRGQGQFSH